MTAKLVLVASTGTGASRGIALGLRLTSGRGDWCSIGAA